MEEKRKSVLDNFWPVNMSHRNKKFFLVYRKVEKAFKKLKQKHIIDEFEIFYIFGE